MPSRAKLGLTMHDTSQVKHTYSASSEQLLIHPAVSYPQKHVNPLLLVYQNFKEGRKSYLFSVFVFEYIIYICHPLYHWCLEC